MIANFHINYETKWGEQIAIHLRRNGMEETYIMQSYDGKNWNAAIEVTEKEQLSYKYFFQSTDSSFPEFGEYRPLNLPKGASQTFIQDFWRPTHVVEQAFFSAAFKDVIFKSRRAPKSYRPTRLSFN